jgi:hypothetical protein
MDTEFKCNCGAIVKYHADLDRWTVFSFGVEYVPSGKELVEHLMFRNQGCAASTMPTTPEETESFMHLKNEGGWET